MDLSFQEKSLWLLFVSLVAAFGFYFVTVLPTDAVNVMPHQVVLFVLAVVLLVIKLSSPRPRVDPDDGTLCA